MNCGPADQRALWAHAWLSGQRRRSSFNLGGLSSGNHLAKANVDLGGLQTSHISSGVLTSSAFDVNLGSGHSISRLQQPFFCTPNLRFTTQLGNVGFQVSQLSATVWMLVIFTDMNAIADFTSSKQVGNFDGHWQVMRSYIYTPLMWALLPGRVVIARCFALQCYYKQCAKFLKNFPKKVLKKLFAKGCIATPFVLCLLVRKCSA